MRQIPALSHFNQIIKMPYIEHFIGEAQKGSSADAGTADMFFPVFIGNDISRTGTHADNDGPLQAGQKQPALSDGLKLIHLASGNPVYIIGQVSGACPGYQNPADILQVQLVFAHKFAESSIYGCNGIVGLDQYGTENPVFM